VDFRQVTSVVDGGPFETYNKFTLTKYYSMRGLSRPRLSKLE